MSSIWGGRTLVILPQFDPEPWLEAVQRERVTHSFVVPTMLKRIMEHPDFDKYDLSSLQADHLRRRADAVRGRAQGRRRLRRAA